MKILNMSGYDYPSSDITLEEFINKQGFTVGIHAEIFENILHYTFYLYVQGILTESEYRKAQKRFEKKFKDALEELEGDE